MAILEEAVLVELSGANLRHFESLGYHIPRKEHKYGKPTVPRGTKILVKLDDLMKTSKIKVTKICDFCGKINHNQEYGTIMNVRDNGKDYCHACASKLKVSVTKRNVVKYEKTLEYYAKKNNKEYLLSEFCETNDKKPNQIRYANPDKFFWNCSDCGSRYDMSPDKRTTGNCNCPYCRGFRVNETNCIATTRPDFAKLIKNQERIYSITAGHNGKEVFVCENCGHEHLKCVNTTVLQGFRCSKCSDGISYPEKFLIKFLEQLNIMYETQYTPSWANKKKYDFYVPSLNMIIETHGEQHYIDSFGKFGLTSLEEIQTNDREKEALAFENGISKYIVINCRRSTMEHIRNSIVKSDLSNHFSLNNVDWLECHAHACKTMVKTVSDLWESGLKSTLEIANKLKLGRLVVTKYLKQGKELGWCQYDTKSVLTQNAKSNNLKRRKKVIQLTRDGVFIKEWLSANEIEETLDIRKGNIMDVCSGSKLTASGFKWMYKKDYEKLMEENAINA